MLESSTQRSGAFSEPRHDLTWFLGGRIRVLQQARKRKCWSLGTTLWGWGGMRKGGGSGGARWGGVGWGGVSHGTRCSLQSKQLKKRDTYAPKATPSNPRKQMNETLTRWGCAFSRARCRRGAHRFSGSRGSRGGKKWSGCGRPARFACRAKTRITENKGINKQQLAMPLVSHTHGAEGRTSTTKCGNKMHV